MQTRSNRSVPSILPNQPNQQSSIDSWVDWAKEVELPAAVLLYPIWGRATVDENSQSLAKKDIAAALKDLDGYLLERTYLVGDETSIADVAGTESITPTYRLTRSDLCSSRSVQICS